jgi:hypothetical protein
MMEEDTQDGEQRTTLYQHIRHPHISRNVALVHKEQLTSSLNTRIAVRLTKLVGSMPTAYAFVLLALVGLSGILGFIPLIAVVLVAWLSQTLIQLVLLPVIMVGQNVLSSHQELQSQEMFDTTMKAEHNIEEMMIHLNAQDEKILAQQAILEQQNEVLLGQTRMMQLLLRGMEKSRSRLVKTGMRSAKKEHALVEAEEVAIGGGSSITQEVAAIILPKEKKAV